MENTAEKEFDIAEFTMAYENEDLSEAEVVAGFQELINSGLAWKLQGSYGRQATRLIDKGLCSRPTPQKPAPGSSSTIGPFERVTGDKIRDVGQEQYRILLYGAYNAMGLVGSESNGIAVLSEDRNNVVCDELGCEPEKGSGATANQTEMFNKLLNCSEAEFRSIVNESTRSRYTI
jgi:hypothetical protein